ncbi:MAG: major capsid protein [Lewinella sp.]|uniref:major capsid protein n=1 Tax=Lewinella sp. TaxID=2004506 RepID=UPI003D6B2024
MALGKNTILDIAARSGDSESYAVTYELVKENPLLALAPAVGRDGGFFESSIQTAEPTVAARAINQGTAPSKAEFTPVLFKTSPYTPVSKIDEVEVTKNPDGLAAELAVQNETHIRALANQVENDAFNQAGGDGVNMTGLQYVKPSLDNTADRVTVLGAGGSGSALTSMYFLRFGRDGFQWLYNAQVGAGAKAQYMGLLETTDSGGTNEYFAHTTKFNWEIGIAPNEAGIGRYANIDASNKPELGDISKLITYGKFGYDAIVCSRQAMDYVNEFTTNPITYNVMGDGMKSLELQVQSINGVPIFVSDGVSNAEAQIS